MNSPTDWKWTLRFTNPRTKQEQTIPARVPGNVLGDLHRAGIIPDPFFGTNSDDLRPYEFIDWTYETIFTADEADPAHRRLLRFNGLDTFSEIRLNGILIGKTDNMFIPHEFDITDALRNRAENKLTVHLSSPVNHARRYSRPAVVGWSFEAAYVRRPRHTYGWDITPRLVGAGVWRNVEMRTLRPERWTDLYLATISASAKEAELILDWNFESGRTSLEGYTARVVMEHGESRIEQTFPLYFVTGQTYLRIPRPHLWYPHGSGDSPLYHVHLELLFEGKIVDIREWRCGVRSIVLDRTEELDAEGNGEFVFRINGEKIFIKGSNWVPSDALHGENEERIVKNLELFLDLGCNMVRCWGGNVYESDEFFDFCDRHGLLVWQDFMFACEVPPHDAFYLDQIRREAEITIKRLRNHASLAVWCGDNEGDELSFYRPVSKRIPPSFNRITREVLPEAVRLHDPVRDYLPSSPYLSDRIWKNNARYLSPEQHLWGPRDSWKNSFYKDNTAIFASEIGYHGMPSPESVKRFLPESSWNGRIGDPGWNCHGAQCFGDLNGPNSYRTKLMLDQVAGFFGSVPESLEELSACSQIVQAEAFQSFIESFRMKKWRKTGLIWWNVIDCWPQFSDAVVDYYYTKKLAYFYIRNSQQNLLMMLSDPKDWCITLTVANDHRRPASGHYRVYDALTGRNEAEGDYSVEANSACELEKIRVCQGVQRMLLIEWDFEGKTYWNHFLQANPPVSYRDYAAWLKILREKFLDTPL